MLPRWRFWGWKRVRSNARCKSLADCRRSTSSALPDKAVGESRERVRAALSAIGLVLPPSDNLSPADLPKEGSHYELPIALGLLGAMGPIDAETLAGYVAVGELGLDGRLSEGVARIHVAEALSYRHQPPRN